MVFKVKRINKAISFLLLMCLAICPDPTSSTLYILNNLFVFITGAVNGREESGGVEGVHIETYDRNSHLKSVKKKGVGGYQMDPPHTSV